MAEPLKNQYGADVPRAIAAMISKVHPAFNCERFVGDALDGYEALELMPRGKKIAQALRRHLPDDYPRAMAILLDSLDQPHGRDPNLSLASFLYLPHTMFVAQYGLAHFEMSMRAQHALTQRFTAEFSIRPFLEQYPDATLQQLEAWTADPSPHVRRLVSEGTRPRLPWAPRLRQFQADPAPVLALLELLKDDPELYVRRSVANNLNDIGKDHPAVLASTAQAWLKNAPAGRAWIVGHALRSAVKRGERAALKVLGFGNKAQVAVGHIQMTPARAVMGGSVRIGFTLTSTHSHGQRVLVDLAVHYIKASGQASAKVFKLKTLELAPGQTAALAKTLSLAELTTRKHYPGVHRVEVILNGVTQSLGAFELLKP
ncbi:DNA alkylation repair protein [Rhodoferax sp.]|uniref:DNA alkylation repair protein n=1 Tax=Rhodoferax sp. TaxID=50421 RepID=UPI002638DD95|nr:DNA alkylation repair protein [Rhodoferax sp.]MDD2918765.1 DNA alkylation repair protein [Rhodoferax sp.]